MRIVIAGGSGFLGLALVESLAAAGHLVQVLSRRPPAPLEPGISRPFDFVTWTPDGTANGLWTSPCSGADVVVNLAGESIAAGRWSAARKARLRSSRVLATRSLARFIAESEQPPAAFVSASAIGYYGDRGGVALTEHAGPGRDFLAELAAEWEQEALAAKNERTRVVLLRTGIVLDPNEGALAKMITPFRLFAGGPFGQGVSSCRGFTATTGCRSRAGPPKRPRCRGAQPDRSESRHQCRLRPRPRPRPEQAGLHPGAGLRR